MVAHRQAGAGAPSRPDTSFRQVVGGPPFGRLPQPGLADAGERHRAVVPEHRQVPFILGDFSFRGRQRPAGVTDQAVGQPGELQVAVVARDVVGQRVQLSPPDVVAECPQHGVAGLDRVDPAALLQAHQQFGDHQRRQTTQTDLPAAPDRRLGCLPIGFVQMSIACAGGPQPLLVCPAVASVGVASLPGAGGDRAEGQRRKRFRGAGQELIETDAGQRAPLLDMSRAQSRPRRVPFPRAAVDTTGVRSSPRSSVTALAEAKRSRARPARVRQADDGTSRRSATPPARSSNSPRPGRRAVPAADAPDANASTRRAGSHPASVRNAGSIMAPTAAACRSIPESANGCTPTATATDLTASAALTGRSRPARGGWEPGRRPRAAGPGRGAGRPATNSSTRDPSRWRSRPGRRPRRPGCCRTRAAADAA